MHGKIDHWKEFRQQLTHFFSIQSVPHRKVDLVGVYGFVEFNQFLIWQNEDGKLEIMFTELNEQFQKFLLFAR